MQSANVLVPHRREYEPNSLSVSGRRWRDYVGSCGSVEFGSLNKSASHKLYNFMAVSTSSPPMEGLLSQSYVSSSGARSFGVLPEILGSLSEPAMIVNNETGTITACNRRCATLFESEPEDIAGKELKDILMLVNPMEAGETTECFFINAKGQCINLLLGVASHPFIDDLLICTLVVDDAPDPGSGELNISAGQFSVFNEDQLAEYCDDETGHPFKADCKKFLGAGASGSVCEGLWGTEKVAVKFIACNSAEVMQSQYQEVKTMQELQHANIIEYKGSTILYEECTILVVLEFAAHGSLQSLVERPRPIPPDTLKGHVVDALHGLSFVHASGIIHRDIKPSNLLLCSGPDGIVCKLTDFGSAIRKDLLKSQNPFLGTPVFMAPEQFEGQVGYYSDVWAIGVTILYCLLRQAPYPQELVCNPLRLMFAIVDGLRPSIPKSGPMELLAVARQALVDSPSLRPPIAELLQALTGEVVPRESSDPITAPLTRDVLAGRLSLLDSGSWHSERRARQSTSPQHKSPPPKPKAAAKARARCLVA